MILIGKQSAREGENGERQISLLRCPHCPGLDQDQSKEPGTAPGSHAQMAGVQRRPSSRASPGTLGESWTRRASRSKTGASVSDTSIMGTPKPSVLKHNPRQHVCLFNYKTQLGVKVHCWLRGKLVQFMEYNRQYLTSLRRCPQESYTPTCLLRVFRMCS